MQICFLQLTAHKTGEEKWRTTRFETAAQRKNEASALSSTMSTRHSSDIALSSYFLCTPHLRADGSYAFPALQSLPPGPGSETAPLHVRGSHQGKGTGAKSNLASKASRQRRRLLRCTCERPLEEHETQQTHDTPETSEHLRAETPGEVRKVG